MPFMFTKEFKWKLDYSDNKIENYFDNTLPKRFLEPKKCIQFHIQKNGWVENNKSSPIS